MRGTVSRHLVWRRGSPAGKLTLKKAGLACVEAEKPIGPGVGSLRSLLTFKQMEIMRG